MPPTPRILLLIVLLISAVCALTAVGGIVLGILGSAWFLVAFEVVVLFAGAMGVLTGVGRFREAPALATLCVGGCVFVAAVLSEPTFVARLLQGSSGAAQTIAGVSLRPLALGRAGAGALLIALSALMVLSRRPALSLPFLIRSVLCGAPVVAALASMFVPPVRQALSGLPLSAIVAIAIVGFFVLGALFSVSVQNLIRAFEVAIPDRTVSPLQNAAKS
jgi:hypothetical protein